MRQEARAGLMDHTHLAEFGSIDPPAADATTEESWGPARPTNSMTEKITMI
jgi:hypothetical protein